MLEPPRLGLPDAIVPEVPIVKTRYRPGAILIATGNAIIHQSGILYIAIRFPVLPVQGV